VKSLTPTAAKSPQRASTINIAVRHILRTPMVSQLREIARTQAAYKTEVQPVKAESDGAQP
jgi:hypothetical protein